MKVMLVNANRFKHPWPVIPFGLCCVASVLEKAEHDIKVVDLCFSSNPHRDLARALESWAPQVVGVSIRNIDNGTGYRTEFLLQNTRDEVIGPLKALFKGPIVIGGPSVGISGPEMLEYLDLNYAISGDGESAMVEFVRRIEDGSPLVGLEGLAIREGGKIVQHKPPFRVADLNTLPSVKPHRYIDIRPYRRFDSPLQVQTKRGCALMCSYCTYNSIEGHFCRLKDPNKLADEIEVLVKETGINHLEFTDSTFNIPLDHCKAVLTALKHKNLPLKLRTMGLNPGAVDEELVDLMKEVGFRDVDLGVESGSDITLKGLQKNFTKKDVLNAGKLLRDRGIPSTWYLLVGAPGETAETLHETFDTVNAAASGWDLVNVGVGVRVYRGSPMAENMKLENPACTHDNFLSPVSFVPNDVSLEEVKTITKRMALSRANYFMYDEDETTPPLILMLGTCLLKAFAPRQPIWRLHIIIRKMQNLIGVGLIRRLLFKIQC